MSADGDHSQAKSVSGHLSVASQLLLAKASFESRESLSSSPSRPSRSTKSGSKIRRKRGSSKESAASRSRNSRYTALTGGAASRNNNNNSKSASSSEGSRVISIDAEGTMATSIDSLTNSNSTGRVTSHKVIDDEYYKAMEEKLKHEEIMNRKRKSGATSVSKGALGQLPWCEDDNECLRDQVAFWKNCLVEDEERVPKEEVRELLKTLYTVLRQETIQRSDRTLEEVSQKLEGLKRLDLQKLIDLMSMHQHAGEQMEGKDVLLLTGAVGSGKTTTLHFLAGTEFIETEVDGFIHLHPLHIKDSRLKDFKTACGNEAITRGLQVASVTYKDKNGMDNSLVVCDTPGFGIMATKEEELAFHYGMGNALDKARRVKPVVLLNQELMGSCFSNLPETLQMMTQDLALKTPRDLKALDYVFTHYEERHRTRLCQQFASLKHHKPPKPENGGRNDLFDDFVNDIIIKTTPQAKLAMPLEDDPKELLEGLWKEIFVEEPRDYYYRTPATENSLKLLQIQLQITLEELRMALSREVYSLALNRMVVLDKLSVWFPQAKQAALLGKEAASRQVKMIWDWMAKEIGNANYERALFRMEQMSDFGLIFPDAHECFKHGHDLIWESLVGPMEDRDYALTMERIGKLSTLAQQYTEASNCVKRALRLLRKKIEFVIEMGGFKEAVGLLVPLSSLGAEEAPEAAECARSILSNLRNLLENTIARKDYSMALHMIRKFSSMKSIYPQAEAIANQGLMLCRETLEASVANGDYDSALFLVQHMQRLQIEFPQAEEIAQFGLGIFSSTVEVLIQHKDYSKAIALMKRIGAELVGSDDLRVKGIDVFGHTVEALIEKEKDYNQAIFLMKEVNAGVGSDECTKKGLGVFGNEVENLIQNQKDYDKAISLLHRVNEEVPGSNVCTLRSLGAFGNEVENLIQTQKDYNKAISLLQTLNEEVPGANACTLRGLGVFGNELKSLVEGKDYNTAIALMKRVGTEVPSSGDCILHGLRVFGNEVEVLIESREYNKAVTLMKRLATDISGTGEYILKGLSMLKEALRETIREADYQTALDIIYEVNSLAKVVPQADALLEYAFNALEEHILISIDRQEYKSAIHLMELLSVGENRLPLAKECTHVGIQVLKRNVAKAIEKKKYSPALDMIQQLSDKGQKIPEVGECSRRGLELLKTTAEQAIIDKDYSTAIEIITNLSELSHTLPEAKSCTLSALHAIVDHVTELRTGVEKTVEEIGQIRDLKVFVAMLLKLKSQVEKVMKSEPLRKLSVQIHYKKNFRSKEEETGESNVLFVPQLYTSQAFCSDHVELLAEHVREKLPEFDVNDACMESLIRNRKAILSVMIRLKAAHKILQSCPGGDKASAIYSATFEQFHALVDTVLAIAEESFKPPIDMRLFELEAWFLSVLIKGFIKDKIDVDSEERKRMEELENRRKILMLQFEVQITDALDLLSDPDFGDKPDEEKLESGAGSNLEGTANQGNSSIEQETDGANAALPSSEEPLTINAEAIDNLDFSIFEAPRNALISLCQRPELVKMVLKQHTLGSVEGTLKDFDQAVVHCVGEMIRYGDSEYNALIEFAKSGANLPVILDRVNVLKAQVDKVEAHMAVARGWGPEFVNDTQLQHQKLLILKKRIELAMEKLETTIKTERDIGFGAFVSTFFCTGNWYEDVPTSFL